MDGKELVRRIFDEIINKGRLDAIDELMAEDFVDHGPMGDQDRGRCKALVAQWRSAVPDVHCEVDHLIVEGDTIGWTVHTTGTHRRCAGLPGHGQGVRDSECQHRPDEGRPGYRALGRAGPLPHAGAAGSAATDGRVDAGAGVRLGLDVVVELFDRNSFRSGKPCRSHTTCGMTGAVDHSIPSNAKAAAAVAGLSRDQVYG